MAPPSKSTLGIVQVVQQSEAKNSIMPLSFLGEIIPKNAQILRHQGTMKTKPCIFDDPQVLPRFAMALCIGFTLEESASFAGCSASAIKKHVRERTSFQVTTHTGEVNVRTFDELVCGWKLHITMLAKMKIYHQLLRPETDTKDAWKILERKEPEEWGRTCRLCSKRA